MLYRLSESDTFGSRKVPKDFASSCEVLFFFFLLVPWERNGIPLGKEEEKGKKSACMEGGGKRRRRAGSGRAGEEVFLSPRHRANNLSLFFFALEFLGTLKLSGLSLFFFVFFSFLLVIGSPSLGSWHLSPTIHRGGTGTAAGVAPPSSFFARPSPLCGKLPLATWPTRAATSIPAYRVLSGGMAALGRKGRDYWGGVLDEFSCAEGEGRGGEEGFGRSLAGRKGILPLLPLCSCVRVELLRACHSCLSHRLFTVVL